MDVTTLASLDENRLRLELYKRSYLEFVKDGWAMMFKTKPFKLGWHTDCLADHLQAAAELHAGNPVCDNQARHTLFSLPPRHTKSTFCSHFYIPWLWLRNPELQIITCAYKLDRARKDSAMSIQIMTSKWYQDLLAAMPDEERWHLTSTSQERITNSRNGQRLCAGRTGGIAGEDADIVVIDDSLHPMEAASDVALIQLETWWKEAISMRFNDISKGQFIIIGQRLSERDIIGIVMDPKGGENLDDWNRVIMPAMFERNHPIKFSSTIPKRDEDGGWTGPTWTDPRTKDGELLFEAHFPRHEMMKRKRSIGQKAWATQYQGRPAPADGEYFRRDWFKFISKDEFRMFNRPHHILQSWDTAYTPKDLQDQAKGLKSAESVCTTWFVVSYKDRPQTRYIVLADLFADRVSYPDLRKKAVELYERWKPETVIIEDQSSGKSLLQDLEELGINLEAFQPKGFGSKEVRAAAVTTFFENGIVLLPDWKPEVDSDGTLKENTWNPEHFIKALVAFPNGGKDITDTVSQALLYCKGLNVNLDLEENPDFSHPWEESAYIESDNTGNNGYVE